MTDQTNHLSEEQLQSVLDGALEVKEAAEIHSHLKDCPDCQKKLARLEDLALRLESLPEFQLSRDLSGPVISRLRDEKELSPGITWSLVIEALAAGMMIGLLIPALQAAGWLPRLLDTRLELLAAANLFLTQLLSSWVVWWAELQLQINHTIQALVPVNSPFQLGISPWILVGTAGGLGLLINYLLLGRQPLPGRNRNNH